MQQSEANRFSFGPGKDFPCQGYTHCCWAHPARAVPLSTPAFYCQNIFTTDVTPFVIYCLVATTAQQLWQRWMLSLKTSWLVGWHVRPWRDEKVWNVERYFAYVSVPACDLVKLRDPIIFLTWCYQLCLVLCVGMKCCVSIEIPLFYVRVFLGETILFLLIMMPQKDVFFFK